MDPQVTMRLSRSFAGLAPKMERLTELFYRRLFEARPDIRPLFPPEMSRQRAHLAVALALIGRNLHQLDILAEPLMELGEAHVRYGTMPEHYPIVRDVLLDAMGETLGAEWTAQHRADWCTALNEVSSHMLRGAARLAESAVTELGGGSAGAARGKPGPRPAVQVSRFFHRPSA